jgi:hypothetical protein
MDFTVFFTVLSGVITFVVGQIIVKLILDPVRDTRKTIGLVSHTSAKPLAEWPPTRTIIAYADNLLDTTQNESVTYFYCHVLRLSKCGQVGPFNNCWAASRGARG